MSKVSASSSKKDKVLALLMKGGVKGVPVHALIKMCGKRSPARIYDLRLDGYKITTEPSRGPTCRYKLVNKKKVAKKGGKKS